MERLENLAKVIRSKNAGPFCLTLDILFGDVETYDRVMRANVITRERMAALYRRPLEHVEVFHHRVALAMKVSIVREAPAGSLADTDLYGAQQHTPLYDVAVS